MRSYERIENVRPSGHGHYKVSINCRGMIHTSTIDDMELIDRYRSKERGWKTAGRILYERVEKNLLKKLDI